MTRQELEQLSKPQLIEIILQLQARLAQLEEQIQRLSQPPKDCSNSSLPPAQSNKTSRPARPPKGKRGPRQGHQGRSRRRQPPDVIIACRPAHCQRCGADLSQAPAKLLGSSQVVELPRLQPVVIEARRYQVACPVCAHQQGAQYPSGLEPQRTFGPSIETLVCYFHHCQHVSYERLQQLLSQVFGLTISQGAMANIIRRAAGKLQPQAEKIRVTIRASPVIGGDETGARVDGHNQWQWVFETPQASYHLIVPTRGSQAIEQTLGAAEPQVWVSDCFSAQLKAPAKQRQLCLAHQLRNLQYGIDAERCVFCCRMQQLLRRAMRLNKHRDRLSPHFFAGQVKAIEAACDQLLGGPVSTRNGQRLRKRYGKHRDALFTFLRRPDVPADNNASARALRKSVVHRKVSGGFRSAWGAQAFAIFATVLQTAQKQGHDILTTLTSALDPSPEAPPLLSLNPLERTR